MSSSSPRDQASSHDPASSDAIADARLEQLQAWLAQRFGSGDLSIAPASADASFRRYFRITRGEESWIAMDAPPDKEDLRPYLEVARMLADIGVNAPRVLDLDLEQGFLLNTDLGSRTYLAELEAGADAQRLYADAIDALVRIQSRGARHAVQLPPYDEALLRREMQLFPEWFCGRHLGLVLTDEDTAALSRTFEMLTAVALAQPRVFVHRDYHSRNLMAADGARYGENPGILDFQDAVCGPVTYDLVSLLRDCYVTWPQARVKEWVALFRERAARAGVDVGSSEGQFFRWFDFMGVQRHLKAIGIFARLWHRDGKPGYLQDIPRTLGYVTAVSAAHAELQFLDTFVRERVRPRLAALSAGVAAGR